MKTNNTISTGILNRRKLLKTACSTAVAPVLAGLSSAAAGQDENDASVTFNSQESDGKSVVVANAQTDVEAGLFINAVSDHETVSRTGKRLEPGDNLNDITMELEEPLRETTKLSAGLYHAEEYHRLAYSNATIFIGEEMKTTEYEPTLIDADPEAGFNYPYYLYAPAQSGDGDSAPVMVEPTNSGRSTDDFDVQLEAATGIVQDGRGREIADALTAPLVVPVFPRPRNNPVDYKHYVHALDNTTMGISSGQLERVDLQLLAMVEDARERLTEEGFTVPDGIMLNGFSASGNFVERFAALHPDEVVSVTAGGLNGMPILPIEEAKGYTLDYHIGVANLEELTGEAFDLDAFREVDQFLYMGEMDSNDTLPYDDAWTGDFDQVALDVYGKDMQEDRFPYSKAVYESVDAQAVFRIHEGIGHRPPSAEELSAFHEQSLAGDDYETLQSRFGGNVPNLNAYIEYTPTKPTAGEQVAFDASRSMVGDSEIVSYEWEFNGEETKTGDLTTYTFEASGGQTVRLTVTDADGNTYESTELVVVQQADTNSSESGSSNDVTDENTDTETGTETVTESSGEFADSDSTDDDGAGTTSESTPGFGIGAGLTALTGAGYLLKRRAGNDPPEQ